jgi:SAM-dependent methyltransferase
MSGMVEGDGGGDLDDLLSEQLAYYGAHADNYDMAYGSEGGPLRSSKRALDFIGPHGDVVELACGTGAWSQLLQPRATTLTCVDGAPETLTIAQRRVPSSVAFVCADLFRWTPSRRWDTVFFAFWLSHVPWALWPAFWEGVSAILTPGGVVGVIDETAAGVANEEWTASPDVVTRRVADGRSFRAVKLRLTPDAVVERIAALGWDAEIDPFYPDMFALRARPLPASGG